jgi:ABC-type phosphate/phosphonate transport system substrate-binding protein
MGIIYVNPAEQAPAAEALIQYLADQTGWVFAIQTYSAASDLLTAMDEGKASFAWLQPEEYLYASEKNIASVALLTSHYGLYGYGSNVYVAGDSGFNLYFDADTGIPTRDAKASLRQFAQKTPCLVSTGSLSGYAYPLGLLAEQEININTPVLLQSHEAVIRAVAAGGICDFGVTYGILGDPRTASAIQADIPDVMEKVKIAWQTPPDIPTLNLSYGILLSGDVRYAISNALMEYARTADGTQKLTQMTGYSIDGIRPASDDEYDSLRGALQAAAIDSLSLISK